jgi:hypothetical protein
VYRLGQEWRSEEGRREERRGGEGRRREKRRVVVWGKKRL